VVETHRRGAGTGNRGVRGARWSGVEASAGRLPPCGCSAHPRLCPCRSRTSMRSGRPCEQQEADCPPPGWRGRSGWLCCMQRTSSGKSHTVGSFLPFFSDECNKQEVFALLGKNASRYNMKDFNMAALYSHKRYSRRRLLKRSNSPFFRQMLQVASTRHFPTSVR
jgi:hypothetical protein